jgi:hypothetical protein
MTKQIVSGFKTNIKKVAKQAGNYPYLIALLAMLMVGLVTMAFAVLNSSVLYLSFIGLVAFVGLGYLTLPILYGVTLSVSEGCRFKGKKSWDLGKLFNLFYRSNPGAFGIGSVFWKSLVALVAAMLVGAGIISIVLVAAYPQLAQEMMNYYNSLYTPNGQNVSMESFFGADFRSIALMEIALLSFALLVTVFVGSIELRKNESVLYCSSALVTDNRMNLATRPIMSFFRREVLPVVKKEHFELNFKLFWPAYVVFYGVFAGFIVLGIYVPAIPYYLVPFLAMAASSLCFAPFYYWERIFDDLFYNAYKDRILSRLHKGALEFVLQGKRTMAPLFHAEGDEADKDQEDNTKDENDNVEDENPQSPAEDVKPKEGHVDDSGVIDFTNKDDKGEGQEGKDGQDDSHKESK